MEKLNYLNMLGFLFQSPALFVVWALALLVAITIHEFAHALVADRLGDPTPRLQGRLTLNPFAHLDPLGTLLLFLIGFGWGRPVMFDPYNLENPRRDAAFISLAGPTSNMVLAGVLSLAFRIYPSPYIVPFVILNISLAIFNLIPIHPLDGGKILVGIVSHRNAKMIDAFLSRYGTIMLLALIIPIFGGQSLLSILILPLRDLLVSFYLPGIGTL